MDDELRNKIDQRLKELKGEATKVEETMPEPKLEFKVTPKQLEDIEQIIDNKNPAVAISSIVTLLILGLWLFLSTTLIIDWFGFVGTKEYNEWKHRVESVR